MTTKTRFARRGALKLVGGAATAALMLKPGRGARAAALQTGAAPAAGGKALLGSHDFALDHIALAVNDTARGIAHVEALTGVRPHAAPPRREDWYWSASLPIGEDSFLEVLGPNPDYRGLHPLKTLLRRFDEPHLLFWYVATDDIAAFSEKLENAGIEVGETEYSGPPSQPDRHEFAHATIGDGLMTQRPYVIQWIKRAPAPEMDARCTLTAFELSHPEPAPLNAIFREMGVDMTVRQGPGRVSISLDTPKGPVTIANPGYRLSSISMMRAATQGLFQ